MYICPKCGCELLLEKQSYKCSVGHCFDLSAKGYVNLLMSGKSGIHGDSKEMLAARRSFLSLGHYYQIIERLTYIIRDRVIEKRDIVILDAGCGEGYYTDAVRNSLEKTGYSVKIFGIDVSKDGVTMAAKRYKECDFAVASVNALPFPDGCFDVVLSLFAPIAEKEFYRVLKKDGLMITVSPSPKHLYGLKAAVYDRPYENEETTFEPAFFKRCGKEVYEGEIELISEDEISALFTMTPYCHKTNELGKFRVKQLEKLKTEIGFMFYIFAK
ncbi:MAG: methyltransferase domain-containing protein [Clostridia bacterium]|nr:methyltransferase domain-containing protein [Clostridia bacterium]